MMGDHCDYSSRTLKEQLRHWLCYWQDARWIV